MRTKKRAVTAIVVAVVICAAGVGGYFAYNKYNKTRKKQSQKVFVQKVSQVNTVTGSDLFSNTFAGVIVAQKSANVKYDTSKTIDEILVSEGDSVKKGDKVLTYNVEAIQLQIDTAKLEKEKMENDVKTNEEEIKKLEEEKKKASADAAVSYTTQILSLQSENARSEYDIKAKGVEIQKLEASLDSAYVTAPIDGTVKDLKEPASSQEDYSENADVIMTITADGDYRVKGNFNEQNASVITQGTPVILRSRRDDTYRSGVISEIDTNPVKSDQDYYGYGEQDEMNTSSNYAFYVTPESLDGFILGQHILIELDYGQAEQMEKNGIWLYEDMLVKEGKKYFVWAKDDDGYIEKRYVEIGEKDKDHGDVEIKKGLNSKDMIAYPAKYIEEGMGTTTNISDKDIPENKLDQETEGGGLDDDGFYEDTDIGDFEDTEQIYYDPEGNIITMGEGGTPMTYDENGEEIPYTGDVMMTEEEYFEQLSEENGGEAADIAEEQSEE